MKNLFVAAIFLGWFAAPAWGDYEKGQGMPQEYVLAYTFAASQKKPDATVQKPSHFCISQRWRSTMRSGRKPLPPGWMLVASEWKIAE